MVKITKHKIIKFFKDDGYKEIIQSKPSRYTILYFPGSDNRIFVGKGGHIRQGKDFKTSKNVTDFYKELIV